MLFMFTARYVIAGAQMEYKRPYNEPESLTSDGPIKEDIIIEVVYC